MTKFLAPLALLTVAAPALAEPVTQPLTFERDGIRYVATVRTVGETTFIKGREVGSGTAFELRSKNGRVTGTYAATPIDYIVSH